MQTENTILKVNELAKAAGLNIAGNDNTFYVKLIAGCERITKLYNNIYKDHHSADFYFEKLMSLLIDAYKIRPDVLKDRDMEKSGDVAWFLDNRITGMSLYVDRFCGNLRKLQDKLDYFDELGVNFLHLMPLMESPEAESDGGYAVSDFRKVNKKFGSLSDLQQLQSKMLSKKMYLMLDIVLNHTSHHHEWAVKAKQGDQTFQEFFHMFDDRHMPDIYEQTMPEIFPHSSPGNFTWSPECNKWVMTVFNHYQWDLNFSNPAVFVAMLDNIFFYANLGVDILRIDAPAFIWKQAGTGCQNLPEAHILLQLIRQCVQIAAPGMALLGEAIVAPKEIMKYFGTGDNAGHECDVAYNATHMALQWDALATGDTTVMIKSQHDLLQKPYGTTWITYTRCHDDIGLGFEDEAILEAGYSPYQHRRFLKNYYSGDYQGSTSKGALFGVNPKTQDARISGSLASLCGLEYGIDGNDSFVIEQSIKKIILMQAHSMFLGGIPMLYYGDELAYVNDYSFREDPAKSYDNRWMHRPVMDWSKKYKARTKKDSIEYQVFEAIKKLIRLRMSLPMVSDRKNLTWIHTFNKHAAIYLRELDGKKLYCVFNFSKDPTSITWYAFKQNGAFGPGIFDYWTEKTFEVGADHEHLIISPYGFHLFGE